MTNRSAWALARALFALATLCVVAGTVAAFALRASRGGSWHSVVPDVIFALAMYSFAVVGVIVARQQPRNAVGWVLLAVGFTWSTEMPTNTYIEWASAQPALFASSTYVAALSAPLWAPGLAPLGTFLLLLFPDGRLPTERWRWWARLSGIVLAVAVVAMWMYPAPIEDFTPETLNPLGIDALAPFSAVFFVPIVMIPVTMAGCAVALVHRYRRSRGVERLQLKWLTATAALVVAVYLVTMIASAPYDWVGNAPAWVGALQNASLLTFMLIPVAVGIAITRYRLYDIDRLINRALVYGAVSAILITAYVVSVIGVGATLRTVTGQEQGNLTVAGSTLAVAAMFRPFRTRVQHFIDRRFYRRKYDARRTVEAFSTRLRQETDLQMLADGLCQVVSDTVQPARITLWIPGRSEPVAAA
ncbi:MAG TPA: hypothetical protein VGW38_08000, partial [Chloroflexota bacterium]|nr:hypothetical protein [Chloroflexota bacterium]